MPTEPLQASNLFDHWFLLREVWTSHHGGQSGHGSAFCPWCKKPCSWRQTTRPLLSGTCLNTSKGLLRSTPDKIVYSSVERVFDASPSVKCRQVTSTSPSQHASNLLKTTHLQSKAMVCEKSSQFEFVECSADAALPNSLGHSTVRLVQKPHVSESFCRFSSCGCCSLDSLHQRLHHC